jgi:hypothetical protein
MQNIRVNKASKWMMKGGKNGEIRGKELHKSVGMKLTGRQR